MQRRSLIALALVAAVLTAAAWSFRAVDRSLREIRESGLTSLLASQSEAIERWIAEGRHEIERLAADDRVKRAVASIGEVAVSSSAADGFASRELKTLLVPPPSDDAPRIILVVDEAGRVLFSSDDRRVGSILAESERGVLTANRGARSWFVPPSAPGMSNTPSILDAPVPTAWVVARVTSESDGRKMFLLAGFPALRLGEILRAARSGESGEAFAFDASGRLISESRHLEALLGKGLLPQAEKTTALTLELREPPVEDTLVSSRGERPLTRLAQAALESRFSQSAEQRKAVILDPYTSYTGVATIGAWQWLLDHEFGLAVEMSAEQAYAPLRYVEYGIAAIIVLLVVSWTAVFVSPEKLLRSLGSGSLKQVGPYRIVRQIGEGSISNVYLARHQLLRRPVAIKVLRPQASTDEWTARFEREVQLASQLTHPNTISIFDFGRTGGGVFYYSMEYLEGLSMADLVDRYGPIPPARAAYLLKQVCASLGEAHAKALIHRDIKPQNIMVCDLRGERDLVKVLDFGLVKQLDAKDTRDLTRSLRILGTPLYMAPERIRSPSDVGPRSDIYSLGALGFYLLTGRRLFETESDHDLTYHILHVPPPRASEYARVPVPEELDDLLLSCLSKSPGERPPSVRAVADVLDAVLAKHPWTTRQIEAWWSQNWVSMDDPSRRIAAS